MPPSTRASALAERVPAPVLAGAVDDAAGLPAPGLGAPRRPRWRRGGTSKIALRGAVAIIVLLCLVAMFAPLLAPYPPAAQLDIVALKSQAPSLAHLFGTDRYSRDVLSRVIYGARISLSVATLAVLLSMTLGAAFGLLAGYVGGHVDAAMMRLLDALLAIPRVLLLVAVLSLWSPVPLTMLIVIIGLTGWFEVSRLVRAEVMSVKHRDFIAAARALGSSDLRIVLRHVLPNVLSPVIVAATLGVANVIILEAGLSYLGIGAREPTASWGSIFFDGSDAFEATWWVALFPGLAILITVLAFNALGDALRELLDPHQVARGGSVPPTPPSANPGTP